MKVKGKNSEQGCQSKLKTSTSDFKFCFSFLACCLLTSLVGAATSSEQGSPTELAAPRLPTTSQDANAANVPRTPSKDLALQLWQSKISIPKYEKDEKIKNELKRIIEQIRSVEFEPAKETLGPAIVVKPSPTIEPNETLPVTETPNGPTEQQIEFKPPCEPVSDQTLQILENLSQHPDRLKNPFELGEVLFLSGNMKEAAIFYQEALNRQDANDVRPAKDRAWILFQIGNCLRNDNPPTAKKMYGQLIAEHPDSLWIDLAKARDKLIDWYQKDKPQTLIADRVSQKERKTATTSTENGVPQE